MNNKPCAIVITTDRIKIVSQVRCKHHHGYTSWWNMAKYSNYKKFLKDYIKFLLVEIDRYLFGHRQWAADAYSQHNNKYTALRESSSGVVVRSTGAYKRLSGHPAGPVLGWVARDPKHYTCQAVPSGFRKSFSWLSSVFRMRRKIEVPPT